MVGTLVPILIAAVVSLITLFTNTATKVLMENKKYNNEQYEIMKKFYPIIRKNLIKVDFEYKKLATNYIKVS